MTGILVLQKAYFLATLLAPLPVITFFFWYNFEEDYVPLSYFIALTAIETYGSGIDDEESRLEAVQEEDEGDYDDEEEESELQRQRRLRRQRSVSQTKTLDEEREKNQKYINPNLVKHLEGPWIGIEGADEIIFADSEGTVRRYVRLEEWE